MEAKRILSLEKFPGQVFSCSALKYAEEFSASVLHDIGEIKVVNAKVIKSWKKYSIHIIDPVLKLIDADILESVKSCQSGITNLTVKFTNNTMAHFTSASTNDFPIEIEFFGTKQYRRMTFLKTFNAFKEALQHFIDIINRKAVPPSHEEILKSIRLVEMGSQL